MIDLFSEEHEKRNAKLIELDGKNPQEHKEEFIEANCIGISPDTHIYRIVRYTRFKKDMEKRKLSLVKTQLWEDPWDNFYLNGLAKYKDEEVDLERIRDSYYGQCWTLEEECDGLWRNYSCKEEKAVKLKTTVGKLMSAFYVPMSKCHEVKYFVGKIKYKEPFMLDMYRRETSIQEAYSTIPEPIFLKRLVFSYEKEVRLVFVAEQPSEDKIFSFSFDPNNLFEEIEISPWCKNESEYKEEIKSLGFNGDIKISSLYEPSKQHTEC